MLERCYLKPTTLDCIRTCWIADAIEQYVAWLAENRYAARSVLHRVPVLVHFGEFAKARGAKRLEDLPAHTAAFSQMWLEQRSANCRDQRARRGVYDAARNAVQQMLRVVLPSYAAANATSGAARAVRRDRKRLLYIPAGRTRTQGEIHRSLSWSPTHARSLLTPASHFA